MVLDHADTLFVRMVDNEQVQELIGNVRMLQGNVRITCDRALQYKSTGDVALHGHVVVTDDSLTLTAPRGNYFRADRRAEGFDRVELDDGTTHLSAAHGRYLVDPRRALFRTNVVVHDSASVITADSLTYDRNTRISQAYGHVTVTNEPDHVTIYGGYLENDPYREYSRVTQSPLLLQIDTSDTGQLDTLFVRSGVMESYRDSVKRLVATDSVRILRADLAASGERVQFFTTGDSIQLRMSPAVWYQRTQVTGDSINVYLRARQLHRVHVMGSAVAISQSDSLFPSRLDQLTGEQMDLAFAARRLSGIDVETRAISIYHLYEDTLANGLNRTSGDRIVMEFRNGKLRRIRIIGGVEGDYFPENMVRNREREYRVPGFLVREDRPSVKEFRRPGDPGAGASGAPLRSQRPSNQ